MPVFKGYNIESATCQIWKRRWKEIYEYSLEFVCASESIFYCERLSCWLIYYWQSFDTAKSSLGSHQIVQEIVHSNFKVT